MKRLWGLVLAVLLILGAFCLPAGAGGDTVRVMTRNQYLGADLTPVITAQSLEDFLDAADDALLQVAFNNFPLRAQRLATEVALTRPDLIGLQEVYDFKLNNENVGPPFVDHLAQTLDALAAKGQRYVVAAIAVNLDITIPFGLVENTTPGTVSVLDRDVILVREGIPYKKLKGDYRVGGLCGVPVPNPVSLPDFPATLQSTPSEDGCNYTIVGQVASPVGPIAAERSFVGVDVKVRGKKYRFVNTHLEIRLPDPNNPLSAGIQSLQAAELVGSLLYTTPPDRTLILAGDFNSSPVDIDLGITPPYLVITGQGFADIWDTNPLKWFDPDGFTCCQSEDLSNRESELYERIDHIFVYDDAFRSLAWVTGKVPIFPLWLPPNWSSDHGGMFAKLTFIPKHRWPGHAKRHKRH
jgi:endonuclease/exonuclease/phosphatase family metal-dependent hydrolase